MAPLPCQPHVRVEHSKYQVSEMKTQNRKSTMEEEMKKLISLVCLLTIVVSPASLLAEDGVIVPPQTLKKGSIVSVLQEPAGFDWVTGKGRKDWSIRWAADDNYLKKAPGQLLRGTSNVAFGWMDVLTHPIRSSKNAPAGLGTIQGIIMGPIVATLRLVSGAVDVATFWIPFWHGVPMKKQVLGLHDVTNYGTIADVELERTLGPLMLWGLGVGYVISGMYFGWNLGLPQGGTLGLGIE